MGGADADARIVVQAEGVGAEEEGKEEAEEAEEEAAEEDIMKERQRRTVWEFNEEPTVVQFFRELPPSLRDG